MAILPEQLGSLRLVRQIGAGKHCQIWEAVDSQSKALVAVKMVMPGMAADAGQRSLLAHELEVASSLAHPTLIRIDRLAEEGGLPHLVMEHFPHPSLKQQIAAGIEPLAPRLQRIVTEIALALDHMHGRGWVHRDLKPENVLAAADGQVKVIDFAIAARMPGLLGRLLGGSTAAQGTPSYMAPEQIRGKAVDARADIYSLGCLLFELLTGRVPYTAATPNELLNKHVSAPIPAVDAVNKNATTAITKLVRQMLGKTPGERPKSMKAVLQQLRTIRFFERMR